MKKPKTVEEYFSSLPSKAHLKLLEVRKAIKKSAPDATEQISYSMPAFKMKRILIYYAAWENHIGLYPASQAVFSHFKKDLSKYETSKGTIKFPLNRKIPLGLISRLVKFRLKEMLSKK